MKNLPQFNRWFVTCAAVVCLVTGTAYVPARADVVVFREAPGVANFGGTDYTTANPLFDAKWQITGGSNNNSYGGSTHMSITDSSLMMLAISEMFDLLPATQSGQVLQINSAILRLSTFGTQNTEGHEVAVYRVATDWLTGAGPGHHQHNANRQYRDMKITAHSGNPAGAPVPWAGGGIFSKTEDVDRDVASPAIVWDSSGDKEFDVTSILTAMYDMGENYGFAVDVVDPDIWPIGSGFIRARPNSQWSSSGSGTDIVWTQDGEVYSNGPTLFIDYTYVVPEPASMGLLALGGLCLLARRKERR